MKVGVFWRKFRNVELQRRLTPDNVYDDAHEEAYQHYEAIKKAGYDAVLIEWRLDPKETLRQIIKENIDMVFNASSLREVAFLEAFNIPYVGSGIDLVATNKAVRKKIVADENVPTPDFMIISDPEKIPEIKLDYPLFVKPLRGRGSAGISEENIIYQFKDLAPVVRKITDKIGQPALVEEFIKGKELTVGIIGYYKPRVLPLLEIEYNSAATNTFKHKMYDNEIIHCPARLSQEEEKYVKEVALRSYKALNAKDFGRIDMILREDGTPYFLEINTFAGLTMSSGKAHNGYMGYMAEAEGLTASEFINAILISAEERYKSVTHKVV